MAEEQETIELNKPYEIDWNQIGNKPTGKEFNQIDKNGIIKTINANTIKGGVITGNKIQTQPTGDRVVIGGEGDSSNDIMLVDDTTGGTNPITGNTASIDFVRSDDSTQKFVIQKRSGVNDDDENVVEMFYDKEANNNQKNYVFIGKKGDVGQDENKTNMIQLEANGAINNIVSNGYEESTGTSVVNIQIANTDEISGLNDGGSRIVIQVSRANTDNGYSDGGAIFFQIINNDSSTVGWTPMVIDKDGVHLVSKDETQIGLLGVDNITGALEWNGTPIS